MIVITGATGKVGSKITEHLLARGRTIRAVGRSAQRLANLVAGGAEGMVGDLADTAFLGRAFSGADAVFVLLPPNMGAADFRAFQDRIGESITDAIRRSGVRYVVNLSSQGGDLESGTGPIAGLHAQEERLNGLPGVHVLHLRPTYFMENLLMNIDLIRKMGIMGSAVKGDVPLAMIATRDIASYAAERLDRLDFTGKTVRDLLGPRDITMNEAATVIGKAIGRPGLTYAAFPPDDALKGMVAAGLSPDLSRLYVEMSEAINRGVLTSGAKRTRETSTATTIEEYAREFAGIFTEAEAAGKSAA